jgi:hypothetical protein
MGAVINAYIFFYGGLIQLVRQTQYLHVRPWAPREVSYRGCATGVRRDQQSSQGQRD